MPSTEHEAVVELFREHPEFAVSLLGRTGIQVPPDTRVRVDSPDLTETRPTELRADFVATIDDPAGNAVLGIVVEVQLNIDPTKHRSWPGYLISLRRRLSGRPTYLLVVCTDHTTARWARVPIESGSLTVTPHVIGPDNIPTITDPATARADPELAMLSAMAHPDTPGVLEALFTTFTPDDDRSALYADLIAAVLPVAARTYLEKLMTTSTWEYQSDFARKYYGEGRTEGLAEGEAHGLAEGVLAVLVARGVDVPDDVRERIAKCTDSTQLTAWLTRAATADTVDDVIG